MLRRLLPLLMLLSEPVLARGYIPKMPTDFDQVDVYLMTVGRGTEVYALYGHTSIRVIDRISGEDYNLNWGIFDFFAKDFVWKFYIGDLNYQLLVSDTGSVVNHYRRVEKRGVIQDKINLTNRQKQTLIKRFIWNAQPENLFYQYHQFAANCSTKPRDYLDEALGGKIEEFYGTRVAPDNFRYHIRHNASPVWWVDVGLDSVSNSLLDKPVTNWQEMFLPERLRDLLLDLPAYDDNGKVIPGKNFLEQSEIIVDIPDPRGKVDPYLVIAVLFGIATFFVAVIVLNSLLKEAGTTSAGKGPILMLGAVLLIYGLWNSIWGTLASLNWLLSRYPEVQANALLLLYWPIDWFWVMLGLFFIVKRRRVSAHSPAGKLVVSLGLLHMFAIAVAVILYGVNVIIQNILPHLVIAGMSGLFIYWLVLRAGLSREVRR